MPAAKNAATPRSRRIGVAAVASIAALGIGLSGLAQASAAQIRPTSITAKAAAKKAEQSAVQVTLVTGDRVTVHGDSKLTVERGSDRHGVTFSSYRVKGHLYVVPSDVQRQIANGRLDRRLFDVTGLIKAKYDDKSTKSIPVIVTYAGNAKTRAAAPGATVTRQLPVVNGAALSIDKGKAASFLAGASGARSATAIEKIWLDGQRELTLDKSVPQIGAPEAWKAGYTGKGIKVAVLDTGIDATHPDLATQVAGAKNFTTDPDGDQVGHGTHVASTIAGTGAASDGKYKGVAPDAKLYDGKVCVQGGCYESDLLAGMEWAAKEIKASVVNFSIGGSDTPEVDPLEEAVNRLTAETGTLFVIAAGNSGPGASSIESPGSADAALTVGAVDKQDQLADFSSIGPRIGDGALKPDVTAPGVDIVAARSKDAQIGTPVGDKYLSLSGTSMATPHTVGAAAILAQEHPNWKAPELKSAITGSAKRATGQTTFQQGAGRIDVAKGIKQTVISEPGNLSFGTAVWPHNDDEPVTKTLTYRNLGDQAVTLNLAATLNDAAGNAAPAGALQLSANTVTVPAGGTASVQATSNTKHTGPDGAYSGVVTATAGDASVVTGIGVNKELESYSLKIRTTGPDGKPLPPFVLAYGLDSDLFTFFESTADEVTVRLPKGGYHFESGTFIPDPNDPEKGAFYSVVQPEVKLTKDSAIDLDARVAKQVKVTVPNPDAKLAVGSLGYQRTPAGQEGGLGSSVLLFDFDQIFTGQIGPALPPAQLTGFVASQWGKPGADGRMTNSPFLYAQSNTMPGVFPTGFVRDVKAKDLAEVTQQINAASDRSVERVVFGAEGGWSIILDYDQPASTKLLADAQPATWTTEMSETVPNPDPENPFPETITRLTGPETQYRAGKKYQERFNAAAFTPAPALAVRAENDLAVFAYGLRDAGGNLGATRADTQWSKLLRDGKVIAESTYFGEAEVTGLSPEKAKYTFQTSMTRETYAAFSTRTDLSWTFSSAATAKETPLPMVGVGYQPKVDKYNVADRQPVTVLPFNLLAQPDSALPAVKKVELQVSGDDGKTWHKAAVAPAGRGSYKAIFATPKGARTISLKAHVVDAQGNITDQTTIGAYPLK
ncbi:S8 family serine peptidase [Kribbella sp. NBC_01505]|uniref:S8 family serine peptidase n=1 Tax=Kribbella sp. NBC_01505 TaxID=2903580 RepID=UPI003869286C